MQDYLVTSRVMLQINSSGWEREPIAKDVSATSKNKAIERYREEVYTDYVKKGRFLDVDFSPSDDKYKVKKLNAPLNW